MAERIRQIRKTLVLSQEKFGELAGVSKSAVSQWESEQTTPERDALFALQKNARINIEWITSGIGPMFLTTARPGPFGISEPIASYNVPRETLKPIENWETPDDLPDGQYALIPRKRVKILANDGRLLIESESAPVLVFSTLWIKRQALFRRNLVVFYASDDRMQPRIYAGDTLLIDRGQTGGHDRKSYLLRYGCELRVQRLSRRYDSALLLQSLNPSYIDEIIPAEVLNGQVEIVGRVVWAGGEVN